MLATLLYGYAFLSSFVLPVLSFSVSSSTPTQCDDFTLTWTGGTAPFQLLLIPAFGNPHNISIPASAYADNKGSYTTQLPFPQNKRFVVTMSDATGFAAGGTSTLLTVGASLGGTCNTAETPVDFTFELNDGLNQCRDYRVSAYNGAVQPVTIYAIIPGGESLVLHPSVGPTTFTWLANVYNGTSIIFVMTDSEGGQGGSSDLKLVGSSDDLSCINDSSPSSTVTPTVSSTSAPSETTSSAPSRSTTPIGAIAGTVLGSLLFLAVTITLGLFFLRKRQRNAGSDFRRRSAQVDLTGRSDGPRAGYSYPLPDNPNSPAPFSYPHSPHTPNAALLPPAGPYSQQQYSYDPYSANTAMGSMNEDRDPFNHSTASHTDTAVAPISPFDTTQSASSAGQRKAGLAGVSSYKPSRFIPHTDIEDTVPPETEDAVVELPPQYTARRNAPSSSQAQANAKGGNPFE